MLTKEGLGFILGLFFPTFPGTQCTMRKREVYQRKRIKSWNQSFCQERSDQSRTVVKTFERLVIEKNIVCQEYTVVKNLLWMIY